MRRAWAVASIACSAACASPERLDFELDPDDLVIAARGTSRGEILEVRLTTGAKGVSFELAEGERAFVWLLAKDELSGIDGAVFDETRLSAHRVELAPDGGCGRCIFPAVTAPKLMFPGESCAPPKFARAHGYTREGGDLTPIDDEAILEEARSRIRLSVPGPCACELPAPRSLPDAIMCPLLPSDAPIEPERTVAFADGRIVAVGPTAMIELAPGRAPIVHAIDPPLGFLRAAGPLPGTRDVLIATAEAARYRDRDQLFRIDGEGRLTEVTGIPAIRPNAIQILEDDGSFYVPGKAVPDGVAASIAIYRCRRNAEGVITCALEPLIVLADCLASGLSGMVALDLFASGGAIGVGDKGHVFMRVAGTNLWHCDAHTDDLEFDAGGRRIEPLEIVAVKAIGDRVYYCGSFIDSLERGTSAIITAEFPAALQSADPPLFAVDYRLVAYDLPATCTSITELDASTLRVTLDHGAGAIDVGPGGEIVARHEELYPELGEPLRRIETTTTGWTIAIGDGGGIYRRAPGGTFERAYGSVSPDQASASAIAIDEDDRAVVFRTKTAPIRARVTGAECSAIDLQPIVVDGFPRPEGFDLDIALRDHRAPDRFIVSEHDARRGRFLTVDLASRKVVAIKESELLVAASFQGGVELTDGVFLFLTYDGRVFEVANDEVRQVPLIEDDPTTTEVETPDSEALYAIGGVGRLGVAWISGRHQIARAVWTPEGTRIENYWFARTGGGTLADAQRVEFPRYTALEAACPDDVVLVATERVRRQPQDPESTLIAWRVAHDRTDPAGETFTVEVVPEYDPDVHTGPSRDEEAIAVLRRGGNIAVAYDLGTVQRLGSDDRLAAPFPGIAYVVSGATFDVIGGDAGHVAVIVEQP